MAKEPNSIRIAIIGGGLAGASLANALVYFPLLEVHVFESAPTFSERGAAVGISGQATRTLQQVIPAPSASELLENAGGVFSSSSRFVIGSGPKAGTIVSDMTRSDGVGVHRGSLLRELLKPLPNDVLHANKKLASIEDVDDGKVKITFEDGFTDIFDAVIGADGLYSSVRRHVLGHTADLYAPSPVGFWDCRVMVPIEKAKAALGAEYFEVDRVYGWIGDGAFILHNVVEAGSLVQCVISGVENDPPKDRKRPLNREYLSKTLHTWLDGPIANGIIDLILDQPDPQSYSQWEHKSTPTYSKGHVCIVGDAAHATSPWQSAGIGQALEDTFILKTLFGNVKARADIEAAFEAYSVVRRPRCQEVIDSSRGTGEILCGKVPDIGIDPDKIKEAIGSRWAFIFALDLSAYGQEAVDKMKYIQERQSGPK